MGVISVHGTASIFSTRLVYPLLLPILLSWRRGCWSRTFDLTFSAPTHVGFEPKLFYQSALAVTIVLRCLAWKSLKVCFQQERSCGNLLVWVLEIGEIVVYEE